MPSREEVSVSFVALGLSRTLQGLPESLNYMRLLRAPGPNSPLAFVGAICFSGFLYAVSAHFERLNYYLCCQKNVTFFFAQMQKRADQQKSFRTTRLTPTMSKLPKSSIGY
jgi:hypothetical protein